MLTRPALINHFTDHQIETAYRYQELKYRFEDAKRHADDLGIPRSALSEDDLLDIAQSFIDNYDCNQDENTQWEITILNYRNK